MDKLKCAGLAVLIGAVCFSIGRYSGPAKVETKEVEKVVYRERTDIKRDVKKREITRPDGTKIVETRTSTKKQTDKSLDKETSKVTTTEARPSWLFGLTYQPMVPNQQDQVFTGHIQKRLFSEVYLGLSLSTQKTIGVSLSLGF